jgi:hypothetical protein
MKIRLGRAGSLALCVLMALAACDDDDEQASDGGALADAAQSRPDGSISDKDKDGATVDPDSATPTDMDSSIAHDEDSGALADAGQDAGPAVAQVTLAFQHYVNGAAVTLGATTPYTNAADNTFGVTKVRYFISNVSIKPVGGAPVSVTGAHYIDLETSSTLTYTLPKDVPVGDIEQISFVMGLPPALNVTGAFTAAPESAMEWPAHMGGGYHYMQLEGYYDNTESAAPYGYKLHTGGLMGTDYSFAVELDAAGHAIAAAGSTFTIRMNIESWMDTPHEWDLNDHFYPITATHMIAKPGMMNSATEQQEIKENGAGVFTLVTP